MYVHSIDQPVALDELIQAYASYKISLHHTSQVLSRVQSPQLLLERFGASFTIHFISGSSSCHLLILAHLVLKALVPLTTLMALVILLLEIVVLMMFMSLL